VTSEFYDHPELYDALLPAGQEASFYAGLARQHAGPVLELACGTGLITVPVALEGLPTVGLDQSRAMLAAAHGHAAAASASIEFVQGDMRGFSLNREFDLIFVARNSLLHLLSTADLLAALAAVRVHLAADGVFAFDIFNPDVRRLARAVGRRLPAMELDTKRFGRLSVEETSNYDAATQVNHATWHIAAPAEHAEWTVPMVLRSIFPQELPLLLDAAGLELVNRFGELSGAPFQSGSRIQACLCRRRR
jgi:SAM-dependent methyltransferase